MYINMEEYQTLSSKGFGREGMQALIRYYEK